MFFFYIAEKVTLALVAYILNVLLDRSCKHGVASCGVILIAILMKFLQLPLNLMEGDIL
jgi:hypothetical protein